MGIQSISPETRILIDIQLKKIADINSKIGLDTTKSEKAKLRKDIVYHMDQIKALDYEFWEEICPDKNDKL